MLIVPLIAENYDSSALSDRLRQEYGSRVPGGDALHYKSVSTVSILSVPYEGYHNL